MSCPTVVTIQPTECIGNSLNTINNNYQSLKTGVCDNQDQINALRTLLLDLSSNMNRFPLNTPYSRILETVATTNGKYTYGSTPTTLGTVATFQRLFTSIQLTDRLTPTINSGGFQLPVGTYRFKYTSKFIIIDYYNVIASVGLFLQKRGGNIIISGEEYNIGGPISGNTNSTIPFILEGNFPVTNAADVYDIKMSVGPVTGYPGTGSYFSAPIMSTAETGSGVILSNIELWKLA